MIDQLKYRWDTRGFYNPEKNIDVSSEQFLQILRGQIVNPNRLAAPKLHEDYAFMMVGASKGSTLSSWAGQVWGPYGYENAQESANWYARISCEHDSHIVFPKQNLLYYFNPRSKYLDGKKYPTPKDLEFVLFRGAFNGADDKHLKVLCSDFSEEDALKKIRDYKLLF